jgi:hypothetical protein
LSEAIKGDDTKIVSLPYQGFVQMLPNELFCQISNSATNISFVGGIDIDLVDCSDTVILNINNNFFYTTFTDKFGIEQIAFEFGNLNVDLGTKVLYLRITDTTNGNKWYSYNLLLTYYNVDKSTRFDYWNEGEINGIAYDLAPYHQSIRLSNCYNHTPVNEVKLSEYTRYNGKQVKSRAITTYLDKYIVENVSLFTNPRIFAMFESDMIYIDGERVEASDFKPAERVGDTNFMSAEFIANPQDEALTFAYQLYQPLLATSTFVAQNSTYILANFNTALASGLYVQFNKNISALPTLSYQLFESGVLVDTGSAFTIVSNRLYLDDLQAYTFANGDYSIVINANTVYNGIDFWGGFLFNEWQFTIANGQYANTDYNNSQYLTN